MSTFKNQDFVNFLKTINLKKEIENKEALFNFTKDGVETFVISPDKTVAIKASIKGAFPEVGKVGLVNLSAVISYLEALGDQAKIAFVKNKLSISTKTTKINVALQNPEYIVNNIESEKYESIYSKTTGGIEVNLDKSCTDFLLKNYNIVSGNEISLKQDGKNILFSCKNSDKDTELECIIGESKDKYEFEINLPKYFITVVETLSKFGEIKLLMAKEKQNCISLNYKNDDVNFNFIVSLVVKKEEVSE